MQVVLHKVGKKFGREWIFRGVGHTFEPGKHTVVLGANGSGKSTLLQVIAGSMMAGEGTIDYTLNGKKIEQEDVYRHISIASPYLDLMDDFTLRESIAFHAQFKSWKNGLDQKKVLALSGLEAAADKQLKNFSSGMKMRVRLLLAILSDTPLLLMDEPCSNLDQQGCAWYANLVAEYAKDRTVIVCSNQVKEEYFFCTEQLSVEDYKR